LLRFGPRSFVVLACVLLAAPSPASLPEAAPNTNRKAAGRLSHDTLFVSLEARPALWRPDEQESPPVEIQAFSEAGGAPSIPGPLLRVREGATIVATIRNSVPDSTLVVHGFLPHPAAKDDTIQVKAGAERTVTFSAGAKGTYAYWATTTGAPTMVDRGGRDATLGGALVVDPARGPIAEDRIFVITQIDLDGDSTKPKPNYERFQVAINGRAWPHTERLSYTQGDSVRMRWVNTGFEFHPMHLHGFYFRIDSRSGGLADTLYSLAERRMVVTERINPGTTMSMTWVPERPGNWLMHCHIFAHVEPDLLYPFPGDTLPHFASPTGMHPMAMSGLILGIQVKPRAGYVATAPVARRTVRMVIGHLPFLVDASPAISVAFGDTATFGRTSGPHDVPVPTLYLTKDEPVRIWVVNHLPTPTAVHWHGIELESYYDGVPGWSGMGKHLEPMIAAGDSFEVQMTPPRAGTFIYHSHMENGHDLAAGLYGALVVQDPATRDTAKEIILLAGGGDPPLYRSVYLNGSLTPAPRALTVGVTYRVRAIDIAENFGVNGVLTHSARPVQWKRVAKDGFDLPETARTTGDAAFTLMVGETADFEFTPTQPGDYFLELVRGTGVVNRQLWRVSAPKKP